MKVHGPAFKGRELYPATYTGDVAGDKVRTTRSDSGMQDDLKHGNTYYTGVETGKGVLLFGRDYVGNRQYGDFMATNIEKRSLNRTLMKSI